MELKIDQERRTLTMKEAAKLLGICLNSAHAAAERKEIPTIRIGRRKLVPRVAFEELLASGNCPALGLGQSDADR